MTLQFLRKIIERHKLYSDCHTVHYQNNGPQYFGYKVWLKNGWWFKTAFLAVTPVNCPNDITIVGSNGDYDKLEEFAIFLSDYGFKIESIEIGQV